MRMTDIYRRYKRRNGRSYTDARYWVGSVTELDDGTVEISGAPAQNMTDKSYDEIVGALEALPEKWALESADYDAVVAAVEASDELEPETTVAELEPEGPEEDFWAGVDAIDE